MTDFAALADEFLNDEFTASPTMGSALGLTQYDDKLDDLSAEALEKRDADAVRWLARFSAVSGISANSASLGSWTTVSPPH